MTPRLFVVAAIALRACAAGPEFSPSSLTPHGLLARSRAAVGTCTVPGLFHLRYRTKLNDNEVMATDAYEMRGRGRSLDERVISTIGGAKAEYGNINGSEWLQTANGLVVGNSLLPSAFDRVFAAAARRPDSRMRILGITTQLPHQYVLEIAPNARIFNRTYFDARTFLPTETVTRTYESAELVQRYSGYVRVCSMQTPSRVVRSDDLTKQRFETVLVGHERLPLDRELLAAPPSKKPFIPQAPLPATLNTLFGESGILVRVDIDGQPYWFVLDSGNYAVMLDRDLVRRLGGHEFSKFVWAKGGLVDQSAAVLPRLDIGPVYATNIVVGVLPQDYTAEGVEVVGMLGCDFIGSWPMAIDPHNQTVTLLDHVPSAITRNWTSVRTPLHWCQPSIDVSLGRSDATLILDLGSAYTVISEDARSRIGGPLHELDALRFAFLGGAPLDATQYVVPRASAGNLDLGPILAAVVPGGRGQDLDDDGILGRDVLMNYRLILDYQRQRTYFRPYAAKRNLPW